MQRILTMLFFVLVGVQSFSQDKPVPDYLIKQDFPDSVKTIPIEKLDGTAENFSDLLNSFKGRKVVIDIWASWCRDCIVGLPKLEELKKKSSSDKVAYVFLSVDTDENRWRSAIQRFGIEGEHYRIKSGWKNPLSNYIVLDWVPRYITLNEEGRVIMPKAILANDRLLEESVIK